ncbi:hypothetical protein PV569_33675 [Streptomyces scabiei]|uniref:hypothetical protein n=1 Tax=Streptomyces scabiei TaxID=1930 RepID=UPI0029A9BFB4|nr:hypothetical protein [Streptomyces scabiei]MDX3298614.1 hypothetical protein [Streptomyces scabiei]
MTVALLPPTTGYPGRINATALAEGPRFLRNPAMGRWHRPRSGLRRDDDQVTVYDLWCGSHVYGHTALATDTVPRGDLVCATCDGRAVGSGQEPDGPAGRTLTFQPRHLGPPRNCPGSRTAMYEELPGCRVGRCLVCGDHHSLRAMGGPYASRYAIVQHPPGPGLVKPCPFHRWRALTARGGRIYCPCDTELTAVTQ